LFKYMEHMKNTGSNEPLTESDDILVDRFRGGERTAFEGLYNRYKERIFCYIYRKTGNLQVAEDLAQETLIAVYTKIHSYSKRGHFRAWIYTIASNLLKNYLKKRSYKIHISLSQPVAHDNYDIVLEDLLTGQDASARDIIENNELKNLINKVIGALSRVNREVLELCVVEGLSYEEAAQVLGCSVKAVSVRLVRARKQFVKKMLAIRGK